MGTRRQPIPSRLAHEPRALEAIASPARQELLAALGPGPATVTELATRLGRSRQALYYHLATLSAAGLVEVTTWRGAGRDRERVYRRTVDRVAVGARAGSARELATADRAVTAMLRLTGREVRSAMASADLCRVGVGRELLALRGKVRLSALGLHRLNGLLDQLLDLLQHHKTRMPAKLYSVTVVVTPSRETGAANRKERA